MLVLFAGNGAVLKISEHTSHSLAYYASFVHNALREEGHPTELVQFVTGLTFLCVFVNSNVGYGETGAALVNSGVDKIFFTGSPMNGRRVMEAASKV